MLLLLLRFLRVELYVREGGSSGRSEHGLSICARLGGSIGLFGGELDQWKGPWKCNHEIVAKVRPMRQDERVASGEKNLRF
jgi:hypothetical protein